MAIARPATFFFKIEGDKQLRWVYYILLAFSVVLVLSSTTALAYAKRLGDLAYYPIAHGTLLMLSWVSCAVISKMDTKIFNRYAIFMCLAGLGLVVLTMFMGVEINGSRRWLNLGFANLQSSEVAKIGLIFYVAKVLSVHRNDTKKAFLPIMIMTAVVCGPIVTENLSTVLLIVMTVFSMMFIGKVPLRYMIGIVLLGLLIGYVVLYLIPPEYQFGRIPTWRGRIDRFFGLVPDDGGLDFQAEQARLAVAHSGLMGSGPGHSYVKNFLPMAYSDFIFSTILEEYGMWGGFLAVVLYFMILVRAVRIISKCDSAFEIYLALGLAIVLNLQAIINMAVGVGLMPVTGQTLPMLSMGGTSNVIVGSVLGVIFAVSAKNQTVQKESEAVKKPKSKDNTEFVSDDIDDMEDRD